jgi:mannonate dehydratase
MNNLMAEAMRWFGPGDSVSLGEIRQTGATVVYSALHDVPAGEAWPAAAIRARQDTVAAAGLSWDVVESVPVSEAIKTGTGECARHLENYRTTLARLGAAGIRVVVYNFMPVLDWVRTDLAYLLPDGREALRYEPWRFAAFDVHALRRTGAERDWSPQVLEQAACGWRELGAVGQEALTRQTLDLFPGVRLGLSLDDLRAMLARHAEVGPEGLRRHLAAFLEAVLPAAEAAGVRLAIHPDDPPFPILGLPRIVSTAADLESIVGLAASPANGVCFCTGSLGVRPETDLPSLVRQLGPRIHAAHLRSVTRELGGAFHESGHLEGDVDLAPVVAALLKEQARRRTEGRPDWRISFRPDHGHRMLDDFRRPAPACPGYPLIGRLRGLAELRGLQRGLAHAAAG